MKNFTPMIAAALCLGFVLAPAGAHATGNDGLFPGDPAPSLGSDSSRLDSLRARIANLEQRIETLETRSGKAASTTPGACCQAVQATDVCGQAATTATATRVVVRRYLVPLGTTIVPTVNSASALSVQGLGTRGVVSGVSVLSAPATFAAPAGVTTFAAPVTTLAPAAACTNVAPNAAALGTTYSTWGAYPTTVYRGVGAVYSNSYSGAALNTGSGVSFLRVR